MIIEDCTDNDVKNDAIYGIVMTLPDIGRRDEAVSYAKQHPDADELLKWCLTGEEWEKHRQKMIFRKNKIRAASGDAFKYRMRDGFTYHSLNKAKQGQIVFFGDSITEMLSVSDWYSDYSLESGLEIYNRGIGGDTAIGLYKRVKESVTSINPKAVVILIGTNDMNRNVPHSATIENMESIIRETKKACPDVNLIIEAVYPINEKMRHRSDKRSNKKIGNINNEYSRLCEKYDCVWLDFTNQLRDDKGNLKSEYTYDGLHINAYAYEVVARNIIPLLK